MNQLQLLSFFPSTRFLSPASPPSLSWYNCTAGSFIFPRPYPPSWNFRGMYILILVFFFSIFLCFFPYVLPPFNPSLSVCLSPSYLPPCSHPPLLFILPSLYHTISSSQKKKELLLVLASSSLSVHLFPSLSLWLSNIYLLPLTSLLSYFTFQLAHQILQSSIGLCNERKPLRLIFLWISPLKFD